MRYIKLIQVKDTISPLYQFIQNNFQNKLRFLLKEIIQQKYEKIGEDKKIVGHQTFEEQRQDAIKFADFIVGPVVEDKYNLQCFIIN